jgi:hypothetical protein
LHGELYKITGIQIGTVSSERHIALDSPFWPELFLNAQMEEIRRLEEINVYSQKENLRTERMLSRQNNAPLIKLEFGTSFNLPVKETNSLYDVWRSNNFTNNILNNWLLTVSVDLSSLFSPLNKKNEKAYLLSQDTLNNLLENIHANNEKEKEQNVIIIKQLEDHIARLQTIIQDEEKNIQDDKTMFERGAITELEYRQSLLEYKAKCTLLEDFTDDLWLYQFIVYFFNT